MQTREAYNHWAKTYDTGHNRTRDLEAEAIRSVLGNLRVDRILEIGCGTGKNTAWLSGIGNQITAVDFSEEMLREAMQKTRQPNIRFQHADITQKWAFDKTNLVTCSLVLEHIKDIQFILQEAAAVLETGGLFYICELHPYRQLQGSRAKFEQQGTMLHLEYFTHHISEFFEASRQHGYVCTDLEEWFDSDDKTSIPRLVSYLFRKI